MVLVASGRRPIQEDMTALSLFERAGLRTAPQCERCDSTAWATTPGGMRCEEHAVEELTRAIEAHEADWMPRKLRRRRR